MCPCRYTQDLGSLSVDVLFGDYVHTSKLAVLPNLEKITGVPSADAAVTGLGQPTMSQLKINGGLGSAAQNSFTSVSFKPSAVNGLLQVCSHCCLYALLLCLGCIVHGERSNARHVAHSMLPLIYGYYAHSICVLTDHGNFADITGLFR